MLTVCPFCQKDLTLSDVQRDKIQTALQSLQEGKCLKIGCPQCKKSIALDRRGDVLHENGEPTRQAPQKAIDPPAPPDLSWLASGEYEDREIVGDIPKVLLLIQDAALRKSIDEVFSDFGYMPVKVEDVDNAIDRMRFESFKGVVYHTAFENVPVDRASFHQHMCAMAMSQRRYIYYILVGPDLHTLYDLEALALSANLTVNDRDVSRLGLILRKGLTDYESLFGPYLAAMREFGKK